MTNAQAALIAAATFYSTQDDADPEDIEKLAAQWHSLLDAISDMGDELDEEEQPA